MFTTPEEKAALKEQIDAAVAAATASTSEAIDKLTANNLALKNELRAAKKGAEIDPAKYAALEDQVSELSGKLTDAEKAAQKTAKDYGAQMETLTKQLKSETGFTQKLLVDNGLTDALVKAGVENAYLPAVKAYLRDAVQIVTDGDTRKAMVGDKSLQDHVAEFSASAEGKHFIRAPANSGGGAGGGESRGDGTKAIAANDKAAIGANLEAIASGKIKVFNPDT